MMNEENESSAIKANNPLTPQQDNRIFEAIPVRPAPWSKPESGSPMNKERALGMFRTANQWLYNKLAEGATCDCGCCFLCAYRFFENETVAATTSPETPAPVHAAGDDEGPHPGYDCGGTCAIHAAAFRGGRSE